MSLENLYVFNLQYDKPCRFPQYGLKNLLNYVDDLKTFDLKMK